MSEPVVTEAQFNELKKKIDTISDFIHEHAKENIRRDLMLEMHAQDLKELKAWKQQQDNLKQQQIGANQNKENIKNSIFTSQKVITALLSFAAIGSFFLGLFMEKPKSDSVKSAIIQKHIPKELRSNYDG